jgi:hypothetical protein
MFGSDLLPLLRVAIAALQLLAALLGLRRTEEKSFECPLARFCPPFVQVLGAIWLGLPDERLKDLLSVFGFVKSGEMWPYETIKIDLLVILSTIYGADYGFRLKTALSLAATDTGATLWLCAFSIPTPTPIKIKPCATN